MPMRYEVVRSFLPDNPTPGRDVIACAQHLLLLLTAAIAATTTAARQVSLVNDRTLAIINLHIIQELSASNQQYHSFFHLTMWCTPMS